MDHIKYLNTRILDLMNLIESKTGMLFHESHTEISDSYILASDLKDIKKLNYVLNKMCKVFDDVNS